MKKAFVGQGTAGHVGAQTKQGKVKFGFVGQGKVNDIKSKIKDEGKSK